MPKVCLTQQQRDADHAKGANEALRVIVATRMMREHITQKQIAQRIWITPVTLSRRLARPGSFTLEELRRLFAALEFTDAEKTRCV
ncbi:MAG: helix-turn-helix transcriptional regulator [Clostridia bacterium]